MDIDEQQINRLRIVASDLGLDQALDAIVNEARSRVHTDAQPSDQLPVENDERPENVVDPSSQEFEWFPAKQLDREDGPNVPQQGQAPLFEQDK